MHRPASLFSSPFTRVLVCWTSALFAGLAIGASVARASTMEEIAVPSAALGRSLAVSVYRPDEPAPKAGWPVLYLLHGLNGNYRDWSRSSAASRKPSTASSGRIIKPMVVVMPNAGNSWYVNSAEVDGPGNYETAILKDLPEAIEGAFAVQAPAKLSLLPACRWAVTALFVSHRSGPTVMLPRRAFRARSGRTCRSISGETAGPDFSGPPRNRRQRRGFAADGDHFGGAFGGRSIRDATMLQCVHPSRRQLAKAVPCRPSI